MSRLAEGSLSVLHFLHIVWTCLLALLYYPFVTDPRPLEALRSKIPNHVALVLSATKENPLDEEEAAVVKSVLCAVRCCQRVGIQSLSVYDRHGVVLSCVEPLKQRLCHAERTICDSSSVSRSSTRDDTCPMSQIISIRVGPDVLKSSRHAAPRRKNKKSSELSRPQSLTLSLASYEASKPFMASLARQLALRRKMTMSADKEAKTEATVQSIQAAVQENLRLPEPDLMIVHSLKGRHLRYSPLELHGFPPWIISLTELYQDDAPSLARAWWNRSNRHPVVPLSEVTFRRALDEYARAELRLGK